MTHNKDAPPSAPVGVELDAAALGRFAQDAWMDRHAAYPAWGRLTEAEQADWLAVGERIKRVVSLTQQPAQAVPGYLTADEREWLDYAIEHMRDDSEPEDLTCADVLEALLQRTTPPGDDAAGGG